MTQDIQAFIRKLLEKKAKLPQGFNEHTDYIKSGVVDSMGIIKFMLEIEAQFDIEITEEDMETPSFRTLAGISQMVSEKCTKLTGGGHA
jgi:D-alanine--poly(phosphoribitol) ligase subunit 2